MGLPLNNHHMKTREIYHGGTISNGNTPGDSTVSKAIFSVHLTPDKEEAGELYKLC